MTLPCHEYSLPDINRNRPESPFCNPPIHESIQAHQIEYRLHRSRAHYQALESIKSFLAPPSNNQAHQMKSWKNLLHPLQSNTELYPAKS